ncbi:hypothetical protein [Cohnella soli]|uniref:DUF4367 domain-containing protein n=1 Tax=Cohnella soli TaxID=425005 RepID=A0ABW0HLD0_9BACL
MEREQSAGQWEYLKHHAVPNERLAKVDITERVMARVTAGQPERSRLRRHRARISFPAAVLIVVLLASASAYAASAMIEIRNSSGQVTIQSAIGDREPSTPKPYVYVEDPMHKYEERVMTMLKPGQVLAYSIHNGTTKPKIDFRFNTDSDTYAAFAEMAEKVSAPFIPEPTDVPKDFRLVYGRVVPVLPSPKDERTSAEYARLQELFERQAAEKPSRDLLVEPVHWSGALHSELVYANLDTTLTIRAVKAVRMEVEWPSTYNQRKVEFGNVEVVFSQGSNIVLGSERQSVEYDDFQAVWQDEKLGQLITVSATGRGQLTEERFLQIVEGMIVG